MDLSAGMDDLIHHENQSLGVRVQVVNLNNTSALYNFLSTFFGVLTSGRRDPSQWASEYSF